MLCKDSQHATEQEAKEKIVAKHMVIIPVEVLTDDKAQAVYILETRGQHAKKPLLSCKCAAVAKTPTGQNVCLNIHREPLIRERLTQRVALSRVGVGALVPMGILKGSGREVKSQAWQREAAHRCEGSEGKRHLRHGACKN